jgi:hypothetical protein
MTTLKANKPATDAGTPDAGTPLIARTAFPSWFKARYQKEQFLFDNYTGVFSRDGRRFIFDIPSDMVVEVTEKPYQKKAILHGSQNGKKTTLWIDSIMLFFGGNATGSSKEQGRVFED